MERVPPARLPARAHADEGAGHGGFAQYLRARGTRRCRLRLLEHRPPRRGARKNPGERKMTGGHRLDPTIIREYDIRGIVDKTLSTEDARAIGRAFGTIL